MYIQRKRFGKRLVYRLRVNVEPDHYRLPPFTLQPLIENCIRHGVLVKESGGSVGIHIRENGNDLVIHVLDNGVGMDKEQVSALQSAASQSSPNADAAAYKSGSSVGCGSTGLGVCNVFERLHLSFPDSRMRIYSKPGSGTCIEIRLSLEECKDV